MPTSCAALSGSEVTRSGLAASAVAAPFEVEIADKTGECARLPLLECWQRAGLVLDGGVPPAVVVHDVVGAGGFQSFQG
jgi:hypothetical protein